MSLSIKILDSDEEKEAVQLLRTKVFVDEQGVPPDIEIDELDDTAIHAVAYQSDTIEATGRLIIDTPDEARIGRMAVDRPLRRTGVGSVVLRFLEDEARTQGIKQVMLHAQTYVKEFYSKHGYLEHGDTFFEAGILHIEMRKYL